MQISTARTGQVKPLSESIAPIEPMLAWKPASWVWPAVRGSPFIASGVARHPPFGGCQTPPDSDHLARGILIVVSRVVRLTNKNQSLTTRSHPTPGSQLNREARVTDSADLIGFIPRRQTNLLTESQSGQFRAKSCRDCDDFDRRNAFAPVFAPPCRLTAAKSTATMCSVTKFSGGRKVWGGRSRGH
jgi:hypothetical protein